MIKEILKSGLSKYGSYWPRKVLKESLPLFDGANIFGPANYIGSLSNVQYSDGVIYADVPNEIAEKELHIDCLAKVKDETGKKVVLRVEEILGFLFDEELWQTEEGIKYLSARKL